MVVWLYRRGGIGGCAFDHSFLSYDGTSRYAQWWGWRRVTEELKRRVPEIVIDGRQAYQNYGPGSWLAGNYPHPPAPREEPGSLVPVPRLPVHRLAAGRRADNPERHPAYAVPP